MKKILAGCFALMLGVSAFAVDEIRIWEGGPLWEIYDDGHDRITWCVEGNCATW